MHLQNGPLIILILFWLIPNTHRRRRRDSAVELSCVGGVYTPVGCSDPVDNFATYMWLAQKIGNWVTTGDWCVHTADTTQLDFVVGKLFRLVETRQNCRQLVANSIHTADAAQLDSGVASASAVCIGLKSIYLWRRYEQKTIFTFSFPVTLTFGFRLHICTPSYSCPVLCLQ